MGTTIEIQPLKGDQLLRYTVFAHYCGGTPHCQCLGCDVTFLDFLEMDHVNGDGKEHRAANNLGTGGARLWRHLRDEGYPAGYQVLCCNCNSSKGRGPACKLAGRPHCQHNS